MKKTARLLTLAVALVAGFGSAAQAADFKIGADVVSSYVWRGTEFGDSPAIQPSISYTCPNTGIVLGTWGSYAISSNTPGTAKYRYQEVDLYATIPAGPFSLTLTDYYVVPEPNIGSSSRTFDFTSNGPNVVEASVAYAKDNLSLLAAINVAGNDNDPGYKNAKYLEAGYKIYDKEGYTAKAFVGAGDEEYYASSSGKTAFNVVNVGLTVTKEKYSGTYVYNPATETSNLVFMASF